MNEPTGVPRRWRCAALLGLLLLIGSAVEAGDWPQWRGPSHDGRADGRGVFSNGPFALELEWVRPLGIGYSAISVAGGRAVTTYADGKQDYVVALDPATGETLWTQVIDTMFPADGGSEGGAKSVPAIDGGTAYALGPMGQVLALRLADGSEIWRIRLETIGAVRPEFGYATSPLVVGEVVVVQTGGSGGHSVTAIDKKTGAVVWSTGDDSAEYQSPIVVELAGVVQVVSVTDHVVRGIDPATGQVHWSHEHEVVGVPTPVPLGDDRFLLPGDEGSTAFRVAHTARGFEVEKLWATNALKSSLASPVVHEGFVYGYNGDFLTCVSAEDGSKVWKSRPPGGHGLILVDGHLVLFGRGGSVVVAEASPAGYHEEAKIEALDRTSYTYPSFADGRIFVRNTRDIAAVRVAGPGQASPHTSTFQDFVRKLRMKILRPIHRLEDWFWTEVRQHRGPGPESAKP